jgi:hypothetical protein
MSREAMIIGEGNGGGPLEMYWEGLAMGNDIEMKAYVSFNKGVFFDIEAKRTRR